MKAAGEVPARQGRRVVGFSLFEGEHAGATTDWLGLITTNPRDGDQRPDSAMLPFYPEHLQFLICSVYAG
jgi:hypothetical protein